jgi:hypothetical protein
MKRKYEKPVVQVSKEEEFLAVPALMVSKCW